MTAMRAVADGHEYLLPGNPELPARQPLRYLEVHISIQTGAESVNQGLRTNVQGRPIHLRSIMSGVAALRGMK